MTEAENKDPTLAVVAVMAWLATIVLVVLPWIGRTWHPTTPAFATMCVANACGWWLILLWASHNLAFQLWSLLKKKPHTTASATVAQPHLPVAILYTTCDDFSEESLASCVAQRLTYPEANVYVLDDSRDELVRRRNRDTAALLGCTYVARAAPHDGLKAGNLNHAVATVVREPWLLLVDADQRLPKGYLRDLVASGTLHGGIAYVQAAQKSGKRGTMNPFQRALSLDVSLFYFRDLISRQRHGFVPLLGHGALVSRAAWKSAGGFPPVVSEDYAFAMETLGSGLVGHYVPHVTSEEDFPVDFGGFIIRLGKYASATADLLRWRVPKFLTSNATATEKWDCLMLVGWYLTLPLVFVNSFVSAYVVHRLWLEGHPWIAPFLPYLYTWMTFTVLGLIVGVAEQFWDAVKFYFWSIAVYVSVIPVATFALVRGLFGGAKFHRTPKNGDETPLSFPQSLITVALGGAAILCSAWWWSPFSPFLLAHGSAFALFPVFAWLHRRDLRGRMARVLVYVPGIATLWALIAMWQATFY